MSENSEQAESEINPSWWASAKRILRRILTFYFVVIILLGFLQRKLLYHPQTADALPVAANSNLVGLFPAAEDVELTCEDGTTIRGWLLRKNEAKDRPLVIYMHGNAGNRAGRIPWYQVIDAAGADVLAMDYHGYGDSDGTMTERAMEFTCHAAWDYATRLGYSHEQIILGGTSLGGGAAVYLCAKQCESGSPPASLFLVSTFSSIVDVAGSHYWWVPVRALLIDRYPSDERAPSITCPVVVMHGDQDRVVPDSFGRKLFAALPDAAANGDAKKWVDLPGAGHNDIFVKHAETIRDAIRDCCIQPFFSKAD